MGRAIVPQTIPTTGEQNPYLHNHSYLPISFVSSECALGYALTPGTRARYSTKTALRICILLWLVRPATILTRARLNTQLDVQAKAFANRGAGAVVVSGNKVQLSKIFDWYAADFKASGGAIGFLNKYRTEPIPAASKLSYFDYDWNLNEAK